MLSDRSFNIVKYCVSKNSYVTTLELAELLDVTSRTIKNDLIEIESNASDLGINVKAVRGLGLRIKIYDINLFNKKINKQVDIRDYNIQTNRLIYIIQRFINSSEYIREENLEMELYVSKQTICSDLKIVEELFMEEGVVLKKKRGLGWKAIGTEEQFRKLLAKYIELDIEFLDSYNMYLANEKLSFNEISTLKNLVIDILQKHHKKAFGINITNLIIHILIVVNRIKTGNSLENFNYSEEIIICDDEMEMISEIADVIESQYSLKLSNLELNYLYFCSIGKYSDYELENNGRIHEFLDNTFKEIDCLFGIKIEDKSFWGALYSHTHSLINRLTVGIKLQSKIEIEINDFVLPNELALIYKSNFYKSFNYSIDDVELYYITIHFGAYLEKTKMVKNKKFILLVSDERLSVSLFIKNKINSELKTTAEIVTIIQSHELSTIEIDKYDYIISTENIKNQIDEFLLIDRAATMLTIRQVQEYVKDNQTLYKFFKEDLFYSEVKSNDMDSLILEMAKEYEKYNYVDNHQVFYEEVLKREQYQSTRLNYGLALPHPLKPLSNSSFISVVIPRKPIVWTDDEIAKLIIFISFSHIKDKQEVNIIFDILSEIASNQKLIEKLINVKSYTEFMNVIANSLERDKNYGSYD